MPPVLSLCFFNADEKLNDSKKLIVGQLNLANAVGHEVAQKNEGREQSNDIQLTTDVYRESRNRRKLQRLHRTEHMHYLAIYF